MALSTGKDLYANREIVGLTPDFELTEGYDGPINKYEEYRDFIDEDVQPADSYVVTRQEQVEVADIMILRWQEFRASVVRKMDAEPASQ